MDHVDIAGAENADHLFGGSLMSPLADPYSIYARLRLERPVIHLQGWSSPAHLIVRYDDVVAGLKDAQTFSSRGNAQGIGLVMGRTILEMDGREHLQHRRLVTAAFSPRMLRSQIERYVETTAHDLIDRFVAHGRADLVSQFAFTFPLRVLARIMDLPISDFDEFHHWASDLISVAEDPDKGFAAARSIGDYLVPILEQRRQAPGEDLLSALVSAEVDGRRLSEEEVLSFLRLLLPAGAETTYRLIGSLMYALLTHPGLRARVESDSQMLDDAIEEALRWESPVQIVARETTRDIELHGHAIPAGHLAVFAVGSANRDESHFEQPDCFDLRRSNKRDHVAFGFGEHFCLGSHLARLETRSAVAALLQRLPGLRLAPAETSEIVGIAFRSPNRLPVVFG